MSKPQYISPLKVRRDAEVHLLCFPFAGGSASVFREFAAQVPSHVAVSAVQLPGREGRFTEPFVRSVDQVVAAIIPELLTAPVVPTIFFGYSMGALVAFELARRLPAAFPLTRLVVSAKEPPHAAGSRTLMHTLSEDALIDKVRELGGTPPAVLESRELMEFFLPRLRADFEINERYAHDGGKVRCPITAFGGESDRLAMSDRVARWNELSELGGETRIFPGKHFFFFQDTSAQAALIDVMPPPRPAKMAVSTETCSFML